jgi:hypothetical protein
MTIVSLIVLHGIIDEFRDRIGASIDCANLRLVYLDLLIDTMDNFFRIDRWVIYGECVELYKDK